MPECTYLKRMPYVSNFEDAVPRKDTTEEVARMSSKTLANATTEWGFHLAPHGLAR